MSQRFKYILLWAAAFGTALFMAMNFKSAAFVNDEWIPVGNDSFYHARRIIDAAGDEPGFYQFDQKIHAPEGSWLTWPWAYDYLAAKLLRTAQLFSPTVPAMQLLALLPLLILFINTALFLWLTRALRLSFDMTVIAALAFALSPLTQGLHGIGIIDHHNVEFSFVLLTLLTGVMWLDKPESGRKAAVLGLVLGAAPAFHNGLFVLQLPVLATLGVLWMQSRAPSRQSLTVLAAALVCTTLLVLLPSEPFRSGLFSFQMLSWFHFYVACLSALALIYIAMVRYRHASLAVFLGLAVLGLLPILTDVLSGFSFISREIVGLDEIGEAESPLMYFTQDGGFRQFIRRYSVIGLAIPVLLIVSLLKCRKTQSESRVLFAVMSAFGLTLLLCQFRLHYFGSFAIVLGWLLVIDEWRLQQATPNIRVLALCMCAVLLAYVPSFNLLFYRYLPGQDVGYEMVMDVLPALHEQCAAAPGLAIAERNSGHYVRYHSDCSVVANNFLLTEQHEEKSRELDAIMALSPQKLLATRADIDYVVVQLSGLYARRSDGTVVPTSIDYLKQRHGKLFSDLTFSDSLPKEFELIDEVRVADERDFAYASLYRIVR